MIEQLFRATRAPFIVVRDGQLLVEAGDVQALLNVLIHIIPARMPGGHTELQFKLLF